MLSDNGGNFVGEKELDQDKIAKSTANQGIKWKFNPTHALHFGGAHRL